MAALESPFAKSPVTSRSLGLISARTRSASKDESIPSVGCGAAHAASMTGMRRSALFCDKSFRKLWSRLRQRRVPGWSPASEKGASRVKSAVRPWSLAFVCPFAGAFPAGLPNFSFPLLRLFRAVFDAAPTAADAEPAGSARFT